MQRMWKLTIALTVASLVALAGVPAAEAAGLRARVYMTQRRIPRGLSERGLLGFMRKNNTKRLRETTKEKDVEERKFKAEMVTAFNRPPGDLEFHVLFYDIHDGSRTFVEDLSTFINDRKQRVFLQRLKLPRPRFKPNRRMELVVTVKRREVGKMKFMTQGERKQHSGKVDFSDEET